MLQKNTLLVLLASNALTLVCAILFQWNGLTVIWGYLIQCAIISLFAFAQLFMELRESEGTIFKKKYLQQALFGIAWIVFVILMPVQLLLMFSFPPFNLNNQPNILGIALIALIYFINHAYSFYYHSIKSELSVAKSPGKLKRFLTRLLIRIIPLYGTIFIGFFYLTKANAETITIFIGIKTIIDIFSHAMYHRKKKKSETGQTSDIE